jgi:hypothetical protein
MGMRRWILVGSLACLAALCGGQVGATGATHPDCRPAGARTQAYDGELKLYTLRGKGHSDDALYVCRRPKGWRRPIVYLGGVLWFKPPAMSLAGLVVAVGVKATDPSGPSSSAIIVYDFAKRSSNEPGVFGYRARVVDVGANSDIGSVVVNSSDDVAYIDCTPGGGADNDYVAPGRQCLKPGRVNSYVVVVPAGKDHRKVVAKGRHIDPLSLRGEGDSVSWVKNGKRHTAPLP